ncbi:hypothetical protein SCLCIDRAFT_11947 [Scleroderma citrinum Foug A]|uniref:Uncharacterized protein n=1 Tax=Scleroderma citrinum Foug A TaxID=1036808 RepID=A0A0C3D711_9AGAM|nr:hypothetical protein SCLCIDRAFT_11947 [Scleroderma citrinum Foug A]
MTHTKQTAKKTTGGTAPRRRIPSCPQGLSLDPTHNKAVKKKSNCMPPCQWPADSEAGVSASIKQTMVVNAGRKALMVLTLCTLVLQSHQEIIKDESVKFQCKDFTPYTGFTQNGVPHLLALVPQSLSNFFPYGGLDMINVLFILGTDEGVAEYACHAALLAGQLTEDYVHVMVMVMDHTNENTGDLFIGPDETECMVSAVVDEVFGELFMLFIKFIRGAVVYIAACGSLVQNQDSFKSLCCTVSKFQIAHTLTFDASHLHSISITEPLMQLTRSVIIYGFQFTEAIEKLQKLLGDICLKWILADHQEDYITEREDDQARVQIIKDCQKAILATPQANHSSVALPDGLRSNAGEYKRPWDAFRARCWLFKEELNDVDKSSRDHTNKSTFSKRTKTVHEWFDGLSKEKKREAELAMDNYCKKNLKQVTNNFLAMLKQTMGVHRVMLIGYERSSKVATTIMKAEPLECQLKPFSTHSNEAKNWARTGTDLMPTYPVNHESDESRESSSNEEDDIPEVSLDRFGNPRLPDHLGLKLTSQQLLVREIFKKAYMKFTESSRVSVPWLLLAKDPKEYIDLDCLPEGSLVHDPSKLTESNVNKLWHYWEQRSKKQDIILRFIKAKPDDMPATLNDKPKQRLRKRPYVEIGENSDEEDNSEEKGSHSPGLATGSPSSAKGKPASTHSPAGKGHIKADPSSPAAHKDDRPTFLCGLSSDLHYFGLLDRLSRLPIYEPTLESHPALPKWVSWTWNHQYLPKKIYSSGDAFQASLSQLKDFPWKSCNYGTLVMLGLGLLIQDCWRAQEMEEPEDGEQMGTPSYLYSSLLGVQDLELVLIKVEVINMQLDQELSRKACPGEESGGDDVARKQKEEEQRNKKEEEQRQKDEEKQQREEREQEDNSRREEQEKQSRRRRHIKKGRRKQSRWRQKGWWRNRKLG